MPIGGKLVLKGGKSLGKLAGVEKKKSKKAKDPEAQLKAMGVELPEGAKVETEIDPGTGERKIKVTGISVLDGKTYEEIFDLETKRVAENKSSHTPWGGGTVVNMKGKVLHGYDRAVHGLTAEERLDIRAAGKSDKFCR